MFITRGSFSQSLEQNLHINHVRHVDSNVCIALFATDQHLLQVFHSIVEGANLPGYSPELLVLFAVSAIANFFRLVDGLLGGNIFLERFQVFAKKQIKK